MNHLDKTLIQQLGDEDKMKYPDFEAMWNKIWMAVQKEGITMVENRSTLTKENRRTRRTMLLRVMAATLVAIPMLLPVTGGSSDVPQLNGVVSAQQKGLGQTIGKSVEKNGIKFTLKSAVAEGKQTVLLYSLEPGKDQKPGWSFQEIALYDKSGKAIKGHSYHVWDPKTKRYNGTFETNWTFNGSTEISWGVRNLQAIEAGSKAIELDPLGEEQQTFAIDQHGIGSMTVRATPEGEDIKFETNVTFTDAKMKNVAFPGLKVMDGSKEIKSLEGNFVTPTKNGLKGEAHYKKSAITGQNIRFELGYSYPGSTVEGEWKIEKVKLNKAQMEEGSFQKTLNVPVKTTTGNLKVKHLSVTPTKVWVTVESEGEFFESPFITAELQAGNQTLEGGEWPAESSKPNQKLYRFVRPDGLSIHPKDSLTLVYKHETVKKNDYKKPIELKSISDKEQTVTTNIGGFDVKWTYYKKGNDLYVESESSNSRFGGIGNTYMKVKGESTPGKSLTTRFAGDTSSNKSKDSYSGFQGDSAEIYVYYYTVYDPDKKMQIPLK